MRVKIALKWEANELSVFETFQIIIWYQQNQNMQLFLANECILWLHSSLCLGVFKHV